MLKQARREMTRLLHPRSINPVFIGQRVIENNVIFAVLAFMLVYGASLTCLTFLASAFRGGRDHRVYRGRRVHQQYWPGIESGGSGIQLRRAK